MPISQYLESLGFHDYTKGGPHGKGGFEGTDPSAPWISDDVRQNLFALAKKLEPLIHEMYGGKFTAESEALNRGRTQSKRMNADEAAAAGLAPGYFAGMSAEGDNQFLSQLAGLRGEAVSGEAGAKADLLSGVTNALNQNEQYINSLVLSAYQGSQARAAARDAGKTAFYRQLITAGLVGAENIATAGMSGGAKPPGGSQSMTSQLNGGGMAPDQMIGFSQPQSQPLNWGSMYDSNPWHPTGF